MGMFLHSLCVKYMIENLILIQVLILEFIAYENLVLLILECIIIYMRHKLAVCWYNVVYFIGLGQSGLGGESAAASSGDLTLSSAIEALNTATCFIDCITTNHCYLVYNWNNMLSVKISIMLGENCRKLFYL